jgi:hypothetical protein
MRQYKIFVLVIQVILFAQTIYCGFERTAQPAAVIGRGMSGSAHFQFVNLWLNPASIAAAGSLRSSLFYNPSPFQLPQLSNYGLIAGFTAGSIAFAAGFESFGFSLYRETDMLVGAGTQLSDGFNAGIVIHLYHVSMERYGSSWTGSVDIGSIYEMTDKIAVGAAIQNLNGADFGEADDIPRAFVTGVSIGIEEMAVLNADVIKELNFPLQYRIGTDLHPHQFVTLRAGVQDNPSRIFCGFSVTIVPFRFDYAYASHADLGPSHSIGIAIE